MSNVVVGGSRIQGMARVHENDVGRLFDKFRQHVFYSTSVQSDILFPVDRKTFSMRTLNNYKTMA